MVWGDSSYGGWMVRNLEWRIFIRVIKVGEKLDFVSFRRHLCLAWNVWQQRLHFDIIALVVRTKGGGVELVGLVSKDDGCSACTQALVLHELGSHAFGRENATHYS